mgnify:FL=1
MRAAQHLQLQGGHLPTLCQLFKHHLASLHAGCKIVLYLLIIKDIESIVNLFVLVLLLLSVDLLFSLEHLCSLSRRLHLVIALVLVGVG